jgi:hypothetical protein
MYSQDVSLLCSGCFVCIHRWFFFIDKSTLIDNCHLLWQQLKTIKKSLKDRQYVIFMEKYNMIVITNSCCSASVGDGLIRLQSKFTYNTILPQKLNFFEPFLDFFATGSNVSIIIYDLSKYNCQMFTHKETIA